MRNLVGWTQVALVISFLTLGSSTSVADVKVLVRSYDFESLPLDRYPKTFNGSWSWADNGALFVVDHDAQSGDQCVYADADKYAIGHNVLGDTAVTPGRVDISVYVKAEDPSKKISIWSGFHQDGIPDGPYQYQFVSTTEYSHIVFEHTLSGIVSDSRVLQIEMGHMEAQHGNGYFDNLEVYKYLPEAPYPPRLLFTSPDIIVAVGDRAKFSVEVAGQVPLEFQWYRDGAIIEGATTRNYSLPGAVLSDNGARFKVTTTNESGTAESREILLTVTESGGPDIPKVSTPIAVDGSIEGAWAAATILPTVKAWGNFGDDARGEEDLSGQVRLLWDDTNLYFLAEVTDQTVVTGQAKGTENDGVEVYIDIGNDKQKGYGADDYRYLFVCNASSAEELEHGAVTGVTMSSTETAGGYIVEAAIPWSTLGATPVTGTTIGFDAMLRDNDGGKVKTETKLVWYGKAESSMDASLWGVAQLTGEGTAVRSSGMRHSSVVALRRDGGSLRALSHEPGAWTLVLHDLGGRVVAAAQGSNSIPAVDLPTHAGVILARLSTSGGIQTCRLLR